VPVENLARKFKDCRFEPTGHTTNPEIPVASSTVDYIFRWLEQQFGRTADQGLAKESFPHREGGK
jgi:ribonucleoside-diphosphate reductase alpha chain